MNIDKVADAIEKDAGIELPGLRESLEEMRAGIAGQTYTPEQLLARAARNSRSRSSAFARRPAPMGLWCWSRSSSFCSSSFSVCR